MLSGLDLFFAVAIVFVGATVMGTVSFGLGLVVTPVLLLFLDAQSVVVIVNSLIAILLSMVLVQTRKHLQLKVVWGLVLGGLAAVPLGVLALDQAGPTILRVTIAVVILLLGVITLLNVRLPLAGHRHSGAGFGFFTSLAVSTLSIGGPLVAIYAIAQRWPPQMVRASLALFFMVADVAAFILYYYAGLVDRDTVANIGILIPSLLAGFGLAMFLAPRMDAQRFRYAVIGVIMVGGGVLLVREMVRL